MPVENMWTIFLNCKYTGFILLIQILQFIFPHLNGLITNLYNRKSKILYTSVTGRTDEKFANFFSLHFLYARYACLKDQH